MKKLHPLLLLLMLLTTPLQQASAEVAVLVHGYMSDANTWYTSGVADALRQAGWAQGSNQTLQAEQQAAKTFYAINLPSLAPAAIQVSWLKKALDDIEIAHKDEPVTLIGHSAGGVVSRLLLVQHGVGKVKHLVTIAAPHLGTERAIQALDATNDSGFFGMFKEALVRNKVGNGTYNTLQQSRGILIDLLPPAPGGMLFWLNNQPHPDIRYTSVVRSGSAINQDMLVPAFSQDMNQIPALQQKSALILSAQSHALTTIDGQGLVILLEK